MNDNGIKKGAALKRLRRELLAEAEAVTAIPLFPAMNDEQVAAFHGWVKNKLNINNRPTIWPTAMS